MEEYLAIKKKFKKSSDTCCNMMILENIMLSDRARYEKPRILCDSMDMKHLEQANPQRQKVDERLPKGVRGGQVVTGSDC